VTEGRVSPRSRFFHGCYDSYCYRPLDSVCGRHLLAAKLRRSTIDASAGGVDELVRIVRQLRTRWPRRRGQLRANRGCCREALMAWCEINGVDDVFGLARNPRLTAEIEPRWLPLAPRRKGPASPPAAPATPLVHPGQLEPHPARHRQGGVDPRRP
jgi:hypothetical protein